ncbi:unnamed protein product, partial [Rotaria sordida]
DIEECNQGDSELESATTDSSTRDQQSDEDESEEDEDEESDLEDNFQYGVNTDDDNNISPIEIDQRFHSYFDPRGLSTLKASEIASIEHELKQIITDNNIQKVNTSHETSSSILSAIFTYPQLPQHVFNNPKKPYQPSPLKFTAVRNSIPPSPPLHLQETVDLLVKHLLDDQQRDQLSSLLLQFSYIFDNSRYNISNIVIENVFNTILHSPSAFRPHRNPHNRQGTQRLIDEFLGAGIIQESNSSYAALGFIVPRKDNRPG